MHNDHTTIHDLFDLDKSDIKNLEDSCRCCRFHLKSFERHLFRVHSDVFAKLSGDFGRRKLCKILPFYFLLNRRTKRSKFGHSLKATSELNACQDRSESEQPAVQSNPRKKKRLKCRTSLTNESDTFQIKNELPAAKENGGELAEFQNMVEQRVVTVNTTIKKPFVEKKPCRPLVKVTYSPLTFQISLEPSLAEENVAPTAFETDLERSRSGVKANLAKPRENKQCKPRLKVTDAFENKMEMALDEEHQELSETTHNVENEIIESMTGADDDDRVISKGKATNFCRICNETLKDVGLMKHMKSVHRDFLYDCHLCSKRFHTEYYLDRHLTTTHPDSTSDCRFVCEICDEEFPRRAALFAHRKDVHSGDKPYQCKDCGLHYASSSACVRHDLIRTGIKPHLCELCPRQFLLSANLRRHMLTHTGERPYECHVCSKRFSQAGTLKTHQRTHAATVDEQLAAQCEICGKKFTQTGSVKAHQRLHSGEMPFECQTCGKRFNISGNLKCHMQTHTKTRPYGCTSCDRTFSSKQRLKGHLKIAHGHQSTF